MESVVIFPFLRKKNKTEDYMKNRNAWVGVLLFAFIGVVMLFIGLKDYIGLKNAKDITKMNVEDIKPGVTLRGKTSIVLDYYCYETSDGNETYRWYLVPAGDDLTLKYIGVKVNAKLFTSYDAVCQSTWDYMEQKSDRLTKSISYQGTVKAVKDEVKKNLQVWANKSGIKNPDDVLLPYCIELKTTKGSITSSIAGAVCLVISLLIFVFAVRGEKKDKQTEEAAFAQIKVNPGWTNGYKIDNSDLNSLASGNIGGSEEAPKPQEAADDLFAAGKDLSDSFKPVEAEVKDASETIQSEASDAVENVKEEIVADKIDVL